MLLERWRRGSGRPLIVGHRGTNVGAVENTQEAFALARHRGADGVELDIHMCGTGELVVFHDYTLERLAGRPARIDGLSLAELRRVELAGGEAIPLLVEVLDALDGMLVNVEIKSPRTRQIGRTVDAVVADVERMRATQRVLISSFDPLVLAAVRYRRPGWPVALLFHEEQSLPFRRGWLAGVLGAKAVHPQASLLSSVSVLGWHRRGLIVNTWTVDEVDEMVSCARMGVDAIITNDPAVAGRALS